MPKMKTRSGAKKRYKVTGTGKLTRRPGLAVLTAGPGVTNGVSAMAQAVIGWGRRTAWPWPSGCA